MKDDCSQYMIMVLCALPAVCRRPIGRRHLSSPSSAHGEGDQLQYRSEPPSISAVRC
jgi:hypothetical protein